MLKNIVSIEKKVLKMSDQKPSSCGVCYTAANNAVRVAAAYPHKDSAVLAINCHARALVKKKHAEMLRKNEDKTNAVRATRYDAIADMMLNRVCPMLPSALELGKEKSNRPAAQRAHAVRDMCSSLC